MDYKMESHFNAVKNYGSRRFPAVQRQPINVARTERTESAIPMEPAQNRQKKGHIDETRLRRRSNPNDPRFRGIARPYDARNAKELNFGDLVDIVNPLHHIPVIGSLYRSVTGDQISPAARLAGGALFGGPMGLASATGNVIIEATSGKSPGGHLVAAITENRKEKETPLLAEAMYPAPPVEDVAEEALASEMMRALDLYQAQMLANRPENPPTE